MQLTRNDLKNHIWLCTAVAKADNIAIFGYYTLISAVLAIFIDTMRSEDSATQPQA